jgi:hypothetical protein
MLIMMLYMPVLAVMAVFLARISGSPLSRSRRENHSALARV